MAVQDELVRLEAERDRLRSVIAYYNGPNYNVPSGESRAPGWLVVVTIALVCGIVAALVAGVFAGQVSALGLVALLIGLPLTVYILSRSPVSFRVLSIEDILILIPMARWQPIGENEARERLAECEAQIAKLKQGRP